MYMEANMEDQNAEMTIFFGANTVRERADTCEAYLEKLYDQYARSLFRYALALTSSADDAEDAVQEVFVRIARDPKRLRKVQNVKAFLFTSVRNASYGVLRRRRQRNETQETAEMESVEHRDIDIEGFVVDSAALQEAFVHLPVEQREVLVLRVYDEMTFREIAETTGTSINTVTARYRYGIERLRRAFEG